MKTEAHIKEVLKDFEKQELDYQEKLRDIDHVESHKDYKMLMKKHGTLQIVIGWLEWVLKS